MTELLTRTQFREGVFERDGHLCVVCKAPGVDAHHITERRLFADGGYYLDNGATLCEQHHIEAEQTFLTTGDIREFAGIRRVILPDHLYHDQPYDKWGNPVMPNGQRLKGELFHDHSVQKILSGLLHIFTQHVKYPRTFHLPWSPGMNDDDRMHTSTEQWHGQRVIVTLKMDGENTTMYNDHIHARSVDSGSHPTRTWVKNFWSQIAHEIPDGWRICGENLYAKHSIGYDTLPSYFLGFSIWDEDNTCLSWDHTTELFELLGVKPVPVLYDTVYDEQLLHQIKLDYATQEGYVIRPAAAFPFCDFRHVVGKFVRPGHVQTTKHWMRGQKIERNLLLTG